MSNREDALWANHFETRGKQRVADLVSFYHDWLLKITKIFYLRYHVNVYEFTDYLHWGVVGLIESIHRYKKVDNADFKTFAYKRIKGEIINQINRSTERIAYSHYQKKKELKERVSSLIENDESNNDFDKFYSITIGIVIGSLLDSEFLSINEEDKLVNNIYDSELKVDLLSKLNQLPDGERNIITYHYYYHMNFNEIAKLLQLSKGRVSQLHSKALDKIKRALDNSEFEYFI